jgi:hypothetical protein
MESDEKVQDDGAQESMFNSYETLDMNADETI